MKKSYYSKSCVESIYQLFRSCYVILSSNYTLIVYKMAKLVQF